MSLLTNRQIRTIRIPVVLLGISIFTIVSFSGCGTSNPITQLRKLKAIVKYDEEDKKTVDAIVVGEKNAREVLTLLDHQRFEHMKSLDLSGSDLTDEDLEKLAPLTSLEELILNNTNIGDEGMAHVAQMPSLKRLFLGDTKVSDAGLKHLQSIETLEFLSLVGNPEPQKPLERSWRTAFRLGIDLAGGTNLVYQVTGTSEKPVTSEVMQKMVAAVARRLNPSGTEEIVVRQVGQNRIEVIIPRADPETVRKKKAQMTRMGSLEFALLANYPKHGDLIETCKGIVRDYKDEDGNVIAGWREVAMKSDGSGEPKKVSDHGQVSIRDSATKPGVKEILVVFDPDENRRIKGKYLVRVYGHRDSQSLQLAVGFELNIRGGVLFSDLTGRYKPQSDGFKSRLAILLDDDIHSAPNIITPIGQSGSIHGDFTQAEIDELINVLNAGALVVPIDKSPISEQTIDPLIGSDSQTKGKNAIMIAVATVLVFMLVYYLVAGVVANLCLMFNLILVMGAMSFIDAAFTLPGLAGIVLTIGMAVDANVLIFERIREELRKSTSMRMAIQNGFGRAFSAIVDANITTLIVAVVLYMIGTDQVRGFAVTLFIGIVMSMFTSLYFGRLVFDVCERKKWITKLKMNSLVGETKWNFVGKKQIAAVFSAVLILGGMVTVFTRGTDILDIDFTGGSMVTIEFDKPQDVNEILAILRKSETLGENLTIERLRLSEDAQGEKVKRFRVRTKYTQSAVEEQDIGSKGAMDVVKDEIKTLLADAGPEFKLKQITMAFDPDSIVEIVDPGSTKTKKKSKSDNQTRELVDPDYFGGHSVKLTLSGDGLKTTTVKDYFSIELEKIGRSKESEDSNSRYRNVDDLIEVEGIETREATSTEASPQHTEVKLSMKKDVSREDFLAVLNGVKKHMAENPIFSEVNSFESSVAKDMQRQAILAMLFSLVAIVAYIWLRFQKATFGIAAVAALVHDVLVVLGMVAIWGLLGFGDFKINLPMIAAFLTIVGYSLNDTIVVFDRIREVRGKNPALTEGMVNTSLNQTLARTILTSLTTFIVVLILFMWGGEGIEGFAFCLVLGVIVGTYSSIYIASPVLIWLMNRPGSETAKASAFATKTATT